MSFIRALFDESQIEAIVVSMAGVIAYMSPAMCREGGHDAEQILGRDVSLLHGQLEPVDKEIWRAIAAGRSWQGRMWGRRQDGSIRWIHADISPLRNAAGAVVFALSICRQLTPVAEGQPLQVHHATDRAPDFVLIASVDGRIQFISQTVSGLSQAEVIGDDFFQYVPPDQHELLRMHTDFVIRTGEPSRYLITSVGPNGSESRYDTCIDPIMHAGQVVAFTFASYDVTQPAVGGRQKDVAPTASPAPRRPGRGGSRSRAALRASLSERERQVLALLAHGKTNREAAEELGLSTRTVDHHVSNLLKKLRVPNRTAAVLEARRSGIVAEPGLRRVP
jgi:PAS domain S-box-containing protein